MNRRGRPAEILDAAGVWHYGAGFFGVYFGGAIVALATVVIPAGVTLVLAIVKPTARWCARPVPGFGHPR